MIFISAYDILVPFLQAERPQQDISLDFITGLPLSVLRRRACDAVLVIVDRFSKITPYIACTSNVDAPEKAELLIYFLRHTVLLRNSNFAGSGKAYKL